MLLIRVTCVTNHDCRRTTMRIAAMVVGVLLMLAGAVWFFQGIGVLPGSFMSGQRQWAINGCITFVIGIVLLLVARRRRPVS
jgi:hypothetical protein